MVKELERIFLVSQPDQLEGGMGKLLSLLSLLRHFYSFKYQNPEFKLVLQETIASGGKQRGS